MQWIFVRPGLASGSSCRDGMMTGMMWRHDVEGQEGDGMHLSGPSGTASEPPGGRPGYMMIFALLLTLAAGCGPTTSGASPGRSAGRTATAQPVACGTASTAAGVKVDVEIAKGHVPCGTAQTIEQRYADAVRSGRVPGNGGGAPVKIKGWTCQGFPTPVVDKTGDTSKCVRTGAEILEILLLQ
jgi:hypothetical protein